MRGTILIFLGISLVACGDDTSIDAGTDAGVLDAAADSGADAGGDSGADSGPRPDAGEARVELGLGIVEFNAAEDGADAELVAGPQGGWHVDVALRFFDLEPDGALLTLQGFDAASGDPLTVPIARRLTRTRVRRVDDHWLRLGDQMVFDVADPAEVTDRDVRLRASVAEADGRETTGMLSVHIVDEVE